MNLLIFTIAIIAHTAVSEKDAVKNPGYDVAPLSKREFPAKLRSVFSEGTLISANQMCREDAETLCSKLSSDNLLLLPCMQNQAEVRV